jgi:hypothetical protein
MHSPTERFEADIAVYNRDVARHRKNDDVPLVRVVAEDTNEPVPGVFVGLTLIGPDGGDGGFQRFLTDSNGIVQRWHAMRAGWYQPHIRPRPGSRFVRTEWRRGEPYVIIAEDGTTTVPDLILRVDG